MQTLTETSELHYCIAGMHVVSHCRLNATSVNPGTLMGLEFLSIKYGDFSQLNSSLATEVEIRPSLEFSNPDGDSWLSIDFQADLVLASIAGVAQYHYRPSEMSIEIFPAEGSKQIEVEHFALALAIPMVCALRGKLVLHASAIVDDNGVVLFVGDSGSGKSTAAYMASQSGWRVLADDFVVIDGSPQFTVIGSGSSLRLRSDVLPLFAPLKEATFPQIFTKNLVQGEADVFGEHPLRKIVFLESCDTKCFSAQKAFNSLLDQVFFGLKLNLESRVGQFAILAKIIKQTEFVNFDIKNSDGFLEILSIPSSSDSLG